MPNLFDRLFGISGKTEAIFFRQLATMVQAGLTFIKALETLSNAQDGAIHRWLSEAIPKLREGAPFSSAFTEYPYLFSPFMAAMITAAERSGRMDETLLVLAEHVERTWQARMEMMTRLVYPFILIHGGIFIPPIVVWFTSGLAAYLKIVIPGLLFLYGGLFALLLIQRSTVLRPVKLVFDGVLLYVPWIGKLSRSMAGMWFTRSLAELLDAGMSAGQAVELAAAACGNAVLASRFAPAVQLVRQGRSLTEAFENTHALPQTVMAMLTTAEQSGTIPVALRKAADFIELEVRTALQTLGVVVPTVIFLFIGAYMGYQIIGLYKQVYAPIFKL